MNSDRIAFIQHFFRWLQSIEYVWLKAVLARPEDTPSNSDIDLLIQEKDLPAVLFFVAEQTVVKTCGIQQEGAANYLNIQFNDGTQLKLDLLTALVRKQYEYLSSDYVFSNRTWKNGVATYSTVLLLEHALLFNYLNHKGLPKKYLLYYEEKTKEEQAALVAFINGKYGTSFSGIHQMGHFTFSAQMAFAAYLKRQAANSLAARLKRLNQFIFNKLGFDVLLPVSRTLPRIISFTGVDGAGKTTLLNDLKSLLSEKLQQRVVVLRHRPSLLPILSAYKHGKQTAEAISAAKLPRQGTNANTLSSSLRFGYYYSDYMVGQAFVWLRYTLWGYTVIYDRYYFDFIVDAKRSNISIEAAVPKWLYRFVAKPSLNIFLYAAPEIIRQRKQELPPEDIASMTERYQALFSEFGERYYGQYRCIENHDRQASLKTILMQYFRSNNPGQKPIFNPPSGLRDKTTAIPC